MEVGVLRMVTVALLFSWAVSMPAQAESIFGREGGFFVGCNYWASHAGVCMWRDWRPDQVEQDLDRLASCGMTVVRVFPLWPDFQPLTADFTAGQEFKDYSQAGGPLRNYAAMNDEMIERFRFLCDAAEKRGIRLIVGLLTGWMSGRTFVPTALERMKVLSDPKAIIWEVRFVRYFVNALKDHKAIVAWDLGNECNCMGGDGEPSLWTWMHQIASEIRLCDSSRPVVSGMHGYTTEARGLKNIRHQGELVDILTTHPYPLWTPNCNTAPFDTIRNGCHAACETTLYADLSGRMAFVEEAGSMGPQIVSEERAARTMRMQLFSTWACGHSGYLWWCGFDQNGLEHAPYDWTAIERELGLFKTDGTPKPTALALKDFKSFVESLPIGKLPVRRVDAVVVASESVGCWKQMQGAWLLARMAGFDIRYAFAESELPESRFYILPSTAEKYTAYSRRAFWRVMGKAKDGATVLVTLGDGAILSDLEEVAGIRTEAHYARNHSFRVKCPKGEFEIPETYVRDITPVGCEILARDTEGRPVMTVHPYGKGKVVFFNGALETSAQTTGWPAYALAASEAGVKRRVTAANPLVGLTEHPSADGTVWVVAVNYGREAVRCPLSVDGRVISVHGRAEVENGVLSLGANDGCVIQVARSQPSVARATCVDAMSSNPLFGGWYADPQIRRFGETYWIFPTYSHAFNEQTFMDVFSSKDLKTWTKHPKALDVKDIVWARGALWAPDAHENDGRYYVFFAANDAYPVGGRRLDGEPQREPGIGKYGGIGVAVADRPEGPYRDLIGKPLIDRFWNAAQPIDQYVFRYKDDWYMVYGGWGRCNLVKLAPDFKSLLPLEDGRMWKELTPPDYKEGSVMFERKGRWYFMYSSGNWTTDDYCVNYCVADSPFSPFEFKGRILGSQRPLATGAGHHSVVCVPGTDEWYICYHRRPIPNESPHHRVVCLDRMHFEPDGSIRPVTMTGRTGAQNDWTIPRVGMETDPR